MDSAHAIHILIQTLEEISQIGCSDEPLQQRVDKMTELASSTASRYRTAETHSTDK
jgi:hypothetical protein